MKIISLLLLTLCIGCGHTWRWPIKTGILPKPLDIRFGNKLGEATTRGNLAILIGNCFEDTLKRAGYTITTEAKATLQGDIMDFMVQGNGWYRQARQKIRLSLRDNQKHILLERVFEVNDGGMANGPSGYQKSMDVALNRLLKQSLDEFSGEFFYQQVSKANSE